MNTDTKESEMTTEEKRDLAISMIRRSANAVQQLANDIELYEHCGGDEEKAKGQLQWAERSLDSLYEIIGERAPDPDYWKDAYRLDGTHAILTDEGWEPADCHDDLSEVEVLDEVNAPPAAPTPTPGATA